MPFTLVPSFIIIFLNIMIRQFRFIRNGLGYYRRIKLIMN